MRIRSHNFLVLGSVLGALLLCGCASAPTGHMRDAHLLWNSEPAEREVVDYEQFGPFWERVETVDGAVRRSVRPLLWTDIATRDREVQTTEWLWPIYSQTRRGDSISRRFLFFFNLDKNLRDPDAQGRLWLAPFWFSGRTRGGEDYAALFPFYGTIREMWWDRIDFTMFPFWVTWDKNGNHTWSVLWPFVQHQVGPRREAWRIVPFWGHTVSERDGLDARFVLWPFWTQATHSARNPGHDWMLWPFVGRVDRQDESAWYVLPPVFTFSHGRDRLSYYRKITCPWPLVMIKDTDKSHSRTVFPFWMHRWSTDGAIDSRVVLWPFWRQIDVKMPTRHMENTTLFPIFHRSVLHSVDPETKEETLDEDYMRVWPFYSRRYDPDHRLVKWPDFSLSKRAGPLERNLLGMLTLYTRGETAEPYYRVDHEALWGLVRRGYGEDYSATAVQPFFSRRREGDSRSWSILGGLVGRESRGGESRWRYLWFFGGLRDGGDETEKTE